LWKFATTPIRGKTVLSAQFRANEVWASTCVPTPVDLFVTDPFSTATTWANQPANRMFVGSASVSYGRDGCAVAAGVDPNDRWVEFDAGAAASAAAAGNWDDMSLKLQAGDEGDPASWKRFTYDAQLYVVFNSVPNAAVVTPQGFPCVSGGSVPVIDDTQVMVSSVATDPDGGSVVVEWWLYTSGDMSSGRALPRAPWGSSGSTFTQVVREVGGADLLSPHTYSMRSRVGDGYAWSAWSAFCVFTIERPAAPPAPTVSVDGAWLAGGQGSVMITGPTTAESFEWWSSVDGTHRSVAAVNGTAAVPMTVPAVAVTLSALTVVGGGVTSTIAGQLSVSPVPMPTALRGRWQFNEVSALAATAAGVTGPALSVPAGSLGAVAGETAAPDGGLRLTGAAGASSPVPMLAVPAQGVTVAVKVKDPGGSRGPVVSQDAASGAMLKVTVINSPLGAPLYQVSVVTSAGVFTGRAAAGVDATGWDWVIASYLPPDPVTGSPGWVCIWSQLQTTAVFTTSGVTPVSAGAVTVVAVGPLRVGAVKSGTSVTAGFVGVVDDVSVWSGTATVVTARDFF
jgi:hypothetical protein